MSTEDLENFEADRELQLAQEYQDVAAVDAGVVAVVEGAF